MPFAPSLTAPRSGPRLRSWSYPASRAPTRSIPYTAEGADRGMTPEDMTSVPGDVTGFDGSVSHVAGGAAFLLCRRAATLTRHGGQWALPGGRVDPGESRRRTHAQAGRKSWACAWTTMRCSAISTTSDPFRVRDHPGGAVGRRRRGVAAGTERGLVRVSHRAARAATAGLAALRRTSRRAIDRWCDSRIGRNLIHAPTGAVLLQFRWVGLDTLQHRRAGARAGATGLHLEVNRSSRAAPTDSPWHGSVAGQFSKRRARCSKITRVRSSSGWQPLRPSSPAAPTPTTRSPAPYVDRGHLIPDDQSPVHRRRCHQRRA